MLSILLISFLIVIVLFSDFTVLIVFCLKNVYFTIPVFVIKIPETFNWLKKLLRLKGVKFNSKFSLLAPQKTKE